MNKALLSGNFGTNTTRGDSYDQSLLKDLLINRNIASPKGQIETGNIDLYSRPQTKNLDNSTSTVRSMSFSPQKGVEVVIPTLIGKKIVSDEEAIKHYFKTGEHLGKFKTPQSAIDYAQALHEQQQQLYGL
jgi:hypothetical protein